MKRIGIAILGLGGTGEGVYKILRDNRSFYAETQGVDLFVESVLEPDEGKCAALAVPQAAVASNIAEVVCDPDVNAVVECVPDAELAKEYVLAALYAGKTVITSNRALYCKYSYELETAAKKHNAGLYFEAGICGGVPIVRTLLDGVQSNKIGLLMAIVDGNMNDILTKMEGGATYEAASEEVKQQCGAADADGYAAAYQLSVLASLAFHTKVPFENVCRENISAIGTEDIAYGKELGLVPKMLAIAKNSAEGIEVRVHPTLLKKSHPLASVAGVKNAVFLTGDSAGDVMLCGKGDGAFPTGSAVVSDILFAATHGEHKYSPFKNTETADKSTRFVTDFRSAYYLRLKVGYHVGVLSKVAALFSKEGILISDVIQTPGENDRATLVIVTHETHELAIRATAAKLGAAGVEIETLLRVAG